MTEEGSLSEAVDLVVIGNLLIDQLPGSRLEPGGAALYTCLAARLAGLSVGLHSVVGEDYPVEILERAGVALSLHRLQGPGGRSVIEYTARGRTLRHEGPRHEVMTPRTPQPFQARLVHLAPMPWSWQLYHLERCDPGTALLDPYPTLNDERLAQLEPLVDRLRYLLVNVEELEIPLHEIPDCVPCLVKEGPLGGHCLATGMRWHPPEVEVLDPTGAGDCFAGGLAAGLLAGRNLFESLAEGARLAAEALSCVGPWGLVQKLEALS